MNLLAAAREAQWSAAAFMGPNTMKLVSPAKVNLLLAIGARREDGYHDADTIMHALALHDTLYPVSYTHLDVYKRQPMRRSALYRTSVRREFTPSSLPYSSVMYLSLIHIEMCIRDSP